MPSPPTPLPVMIAPLRTLALVSIAVGLSACQMTGESGLLDPRASVFSGTTRVDAAEIRAEGAGASLGTPVGGVGAGVGAATFTAPVSPTAAASPPPELFGPWTLARSGSRGCSVTLGSQNAVGDYTARTRGCETLPLARVALWTPVDDGLVMFDFSRAPVVALRPAGRNVYEGRLADGSAVTLWR
ncbi:AprI/Inh family metalloprotease inhibitor [Chthonobacter rhizosphaerae]|uniref:AprI/Inh family metalloprotease inhibitor n=1 Tax=Chthonobacter rhizosphaerae TaxID=2735553 RepID=UPI0015EF2CDB|nr:AprI/Inh family metalloprotease inhibitor [Chthonobacter rhizosphaerae]